jgi:opacity protein-like surface antigen
MKNIIVVIALLITALPAFAQISKGTSTLGGNISFLREKNQYVNKVLYYYDKSESTSKTLSLTPTYGYFIANNLCVGANISTVFTRTTFPETVNAPELEGNSRSLGAGPLVRYYIPLDDKLYAFATAGYTWFWTRSENESAGNGRVITTNTSKSRYTTLDAGLGLSYFINPSAAVEAGFGYTHARNIDSGGNVNNKTNTIAFNIGFRIFLKKS